MLNKRMEIILDSNSCQRQFNLFMFILSKECLIISICIYLRQTNYFASRTALSYKALTGIKKLKFFIDQSLYVRKAVFAYQNMKVGDGIFATLVTKAINYLDFSYYHNVIWRVSFDKIQKRIYFCLLN